MGREAKFKRVKKPRTEFFGFVEGDEIGDRVVPGIYNGENRDRMLNDGEIGMAEYGFMSGWDDALDEPEDIFDETQAE